MKNLLSALLVIGFAVPGAANAEWIDEIIQSAQAGNGIYVETHSSASSGGQTVQGGQTVTTGPSSASSYVESHINANNSGGTVEVKVETTHDGVTETKEYADDIASGEAVNVNVSAKVDAEGSAIESNVPLKEENHNSILEDGGAEIDSEAETEGGIGKVLEAVPNFFKKVFDFLWGW